MLISNTKNYLGTSKLSNYLKHKINNWYINAKEDYGVAGRFINIKTCGEHLNIEWVENGKIHDLDIGYYNNFTMEQLYNIWMEQD